ncbi:unnamed protein product, partial [marine sediment metagenome]
SFFAEKVDTDASKIAMMLVQDKQKASMVIKKIQEILDQPSVAKVK